MTGRFEQDASAQQSYSCSAAITPTKAYNANTGILTIGGLSNSNVARYYDGRTRVYASGSLSIKVYMVKGKIQ